MVAFAPFQVGGAHVLACTGKDLVLVLRDEIASFDEGLVLSRPHGEVRGIATNCRHFGECCLCFL